MFIVTVMMLFGLVGLHGAVVPVTQGMVDLHSEILSERSEYVRDPDNAKRGFTNIQAGFKTISDGPIEFGLRARLLSASRNPGGPEYVETNMPNVELHGNSLFIDKKKVMKFLSEGKEHKVREIPYILRSEDAEHTTGLDAFFIKITEDEKLVFCAVAHEGFYVYFKNDGKVLLIPFTSGCKIMKPIEVDAKNIDKLEIRSATIIAKGECNIPLTARSMIFSGDLKFLKSPKRNRRDRIHCDYRISSFFGYLKASCAKGRRMVDARFAYGAAEIEGLAEEDVLFRENSKSIIGDIKNGADYHRALRFFITEQVGPVVIGETKFVARNAGREDLLEKLKSIAEGMQHVENRSAAEAARGGDNFGAAADENEVDDFSDIWPQ